MHEIGWTEPGKFDINKQALEHAIQCYHIFLDLASKTLRKIFVPTRDIDLVWHTHMLGFEKYR
jgi:hypothetical protein